MAKRRHTLTDRGTGLWLVAPFFNSTTKNKKSPTIGLSWIAGTAPQPLSLFVAR